MVAFKSVIVSTDHAFSLESQYRPNIDELLFFL